MAQAPVANKIDQQNKKKAQRPKQVDRNNERKAQIEVGQQIQRVILGQEITFTLEIVPAGTVESSVSVFGENERSQAHLNETSLSDILPSIKDSEIVVPAWGRKVGKGFEAADGSRRRASAIIANKAYPIFVADLNDEQMRFLSETGNKYKPTSAWEKGLRLRAMAENMELKDIAAKEGRDTKTIRREIRTGCLPADIINSFVELNDLSARAGERIYKALWSKSKIDAAPVSGIIDDEPEEYILENAQRIQGLSIEERKELDIEKELLKKQGKGNAKSQPRQEVLAAGCKLKVSDKGLMNFSVNVKDEKLRKKIERDMKKVIDRHLKQ